MKNKHRAFSITIVLIEDSDPTFQIMSFMRTITVALTGAAGIYGGLVLYRYVDILLSFHH